MKKSYVVTLVGILVPTLTLVANVPAGFILPDEKSLRLLLLVGIVMAYGPATTIGHFSPKRWSPATPWGLALATTVGLAIGTLFLSLAKLEILATIAGTFITCNIWGIISGAIARRLNGPHWTAERYETEMSPDSFSSDDEVARQGVRNLR